MEQLKEQAEACGPGCRCNEGQTGRARWVVGAIIIVIAGVLSARAMMKSDSFSAQKQRNTEFALSQSIGTTSNVDTVPKPETSDDLSPDAEDRQGKGQETCGEFIRSVGDLKQKATDKDAVFIFLAGQNAGKNREIVSVIENGAANLRGRNISLGVFTLEDGSEEYANLAKQFAPPSVIAMVKGRGTSAVSSDITESKLMQAFVTASGAKGGCCPGGASSAGCK